MEACLRLAALLVVSSVSYGASVQKNPVSSQDPITLADAIAAYNRAPEVTSVFRLYGADRESRLDTATSSGFLLFTIKETVCSREAELQSRDKCHFKDKGMVKDCTATSSEKLGNKTLVVTCETVTAKAPVRRPRQVYHCTRLSNNIQRCRIVRPSVNTSLSGGSSSSTSEI